MLPRKGMGFALRVPAPLLTSDVALGWFLNLSKAEGLFVVVVVFMFKLRKITTLPGRVM